MPEAPDSRTLAEWRHHLQDEFDAAYLYGRLADLESNPKKQHLYTRLADVEGRHTALWKDLFTEHGIPTPKQAPSLRARLLAWVGARFSPDLLLGMLLREEGQEVKNYISLYRSSAPGSPRATARTLAKESAEHAESLSEITEGGGEPWHQTESGGFLRNVVYGFNDGLTANFGLVAGVIGAAVQPHVLLVTGIAGAIADSLSMGASGYLAAKSEQEVYAHEIAMEKEEIRLMPELEEEELALIYETRGMEEEKAKELAREVMASPEQALEEKVREELKIGDPHTTPLREGWITGTATAVGAFIPVAPFLFLRGPAAVWTAFAVSMLSHFAVGAARSVFTGRGIFRSGIDMFVVGLGVAGVGYLVGDLLVRWLLLPG